MFEPAQVLQVFITADERHGDRPLYEALFAACREHGLAGATVIRNIEGFDDSPGIAREHWMRHAEPVAIIIVDRPEAIDRFLAATERWIAHGVVLRSSAQVRRIDRSEHVA
jgi:hypothetical protein